MSKTIFVSDVHGAYHTLIRLLNQVAIKHPGARLVSGGDEIDRGPHSRAVVEFMMTHDIVSTASNHIDLALAYSAHARRGYKARCTNYYDRDVWLDNGGEEALANWQPDMTKWREGLPKDVLDWMVARPPYIIIDTPDDQGRKLLCSHTGYGLNADTGHWFSTLWGRHPYDGDFPEDDFYRVFGHSRVQQAVATERWANVDSGAAYGEPYGHLTAFIWPSKETIVQPFDETPVSQGFVVRDGALVPDRL